MPVEKFVAEFAARIIGAGELVKRRQHRIGGQKQRGARMPVDPVADRTQLCDRRRRLARGRMYSLCRCPAGPGMTSVRKCGKRLDHGPGRPNGLNRSITSSAATAEGRAAGTAPRCAAETVSGTPSASLVLIHWRVTVGPDHMVIRLTLYPAAITVSKSSSRRAQASPSYASWRIAKSGSMSIVTCVTMPKASSPTTMRRNRGRRAAGDEVASRSDEVERCRPGLIHSSADAARSKFAVSAQAPSTTGRAPFALDLSCLPVLPAVPF